MTASAPVARAVDHLVLSVSGLAVARDRLTALGFTVASDAVHPFGTANCCVFFADKTYLEPLAVADPVACATAALAGNAFVARDRAFRFRRGEDGFSGIALSTTDALADHETFRAMGVSGGDVLNFSRNMTLPDGTSSEGSFRLAFAADLRAPDFLLFTCQRLKSLPSDRAALETHANGVTGIAEIILSEPAPGDFLDVIEAIFETPATSTPTHAVTLMAGTVRVSVLDPDAMAEVFGKRTTTHSRGLRGHAILFRTRDLEAVKTALANNAVPFLMRNKHLIVPEQPGQGCLFVFGEEE